MHNVEALINELVPELNPVAVKKLGIREAVKKVAAYWNEKRLEASKKPESLGIYGRAMLYAFLSVPSLAFITQLLVYPSFSLAAACFVGTLVVIFLVWLSSLQEKDPPSSESTFFLYSLLTIIIGGTGFGWKGVFSYALIPVLIIAVQARHFIKKDEREQLSSSTTLPSIESVQRRLMDKMRQVVADAKSKIEGSNSEFENRIAEIKAKINQLKTLERIFTSRFKETGDSRFEIKANKAKEARRVFESELGALNIEQEKVLTLFREIEAFIPAEEARLADDKHEAELARLCGEETQGREVSREMLMGIIEPLQSRLLVLNNARERLLSHSISALQPISLERFLEKTEIGAESVITTLHRIEALTPSSTQVS